MSATYRVSAGVKDRFFEEVLSWGGKIVKSTWMVEDVTEAQLYRILRGLPQSCFRWMNISEN